ncbi:MAG: glucosamine-6-phosphate deaminase [Thermoplasmata archaeon]|uniref:Glucosamine-6-phosphate deaminase n=1 Tax=Candidatus Sysuiplasma superficiale TaxID=2823368 RepID=A0A8J8CGN5_9ARCH|nr:glucosamine-6-phosphate deaminase [Candidatus Sysuiplasma superficiale]MBX8644546.1 glucosamine-6-phosphate deaminase [Candidatus Sysuiplasma superficiale]MCL4347147.1 glucosamine-6-phosphate deaminase [Candidatus Thermoplasmatota archaeon]
MRKLEIDGIRVIVFDDTKSMIAEAVSYLYDVLRTDPESVIGLATGDTFIPFYSMIAETFRKARVSFKDVTTFNLDEYVGLPEDSPHSYHTYMEQNLFSKVDINRKNAHLPDGSAPDPEEAASEYEKLIREAGGIDLQFLGLGRNGHIGFNEPGTSFDSLTHVTELSEGTVLANAHLFGSPEDVPHRAITMGIRTILDARRVVLLAFGENKSVAIRDTFTRGITESVPASSLKLHRRATFLLDSAAAKFIT